MRAARLLPLIVALLAAFPAASSSFQPPKKDQEKDKEAAFDESVLDEKTLREAKLPTDGPALLKYFRDRTYKEADPKRLAKLVQQLGDKDFKVREQAFTDLLALGATALGVLKEALNSPDEEVAKRAAELRARIEERANPAIQSATARLIGHRKPEGAAEVLLLYLPFAADDMVVDDICKALGQVAVRDGKAEPIVVESLKDKLAVKRGAAGAAVVAGNAKEHFAAARALLQDPAAEVRLRVAVALVSHRDKEAVPALIECLKDMPAEKTWSAEELLLRIAGQDAPQVSLGTDEPSRLKCFEAWKTWWDKHGKAMDLAKVDFSNTQLGYTVVVYQNQPMGGGKPFRPGSWVVELDAAKNVRWQFEVQNYCMDATVIGPDKVLCVERNNQRVTVRDFKGNVKWEKTTGANVLSAQKLANGNTLVVTQNSLSELDANGKEVFLHQRNAFDVYRGRKLRGGDYIFITTQGQVYRLEAKDRKESLLFNIGFLGNIYGSLEELPNGNLLIPLYQKNMVVEYDIKGNQVWTVSVQNPTSAQRLPNGNTLISSQTQRRVLEVNRNGTEVWSHTVEGPVFMARRR